jgi:hypothetical protein
MALERPHEGISHLKFLDQNSHAQIMNSQSNDTHDKS